MYLRDHSAKLEPQQTEFASYIYPGPTQGHACVDGIHSVLILPECS